MLSYAKHEYVEDFIKDSGKTMVETKIVDNEWVSLKKISQKTQFVQEILKHISCDSRDLTEYQEQPENFGKSP